MDSIVVIGTGYVGLVTAVCLAEKGHNITCLDIDSKKIEALENGIVPFFEPSLEEMVQKNHQRLTFITDYDKALKNASIAMIAVNTPTGADGTCDLSSVRSTAHAIRSSMQSDLTIVMKSTVPVGTSSLVHSILDSCPYTVDVVSNPEFLREGCAIHDFMHPDRIIIGAPNKRSEAVLMAMYAPFKHPLEKFVIMDPASSELTKYAANTMLACRISFMNWMSTLCESTGADIESIRRGLGTDMRIGPHFLRPGIGFGGSCFPKDIRALISIANQYNLTAELVKAIDLINERQKYLLFSKVEQYFATRGSLEGKKIAILGLAFKPNTDDMREAPSLTIINQLIEKKANLSLFDPVAMNNAKESLQDSHLISWCSNEWEAIENADAIILTTEWKQFRTLNLENVLKAMQGRAFFDGRNAFNPEKMQEIGFDYISIGRAPRYGSVQLVDKALQTTTSVTP